MPKVKTISDDPTAVKYVRELRVYRAKAGLKQIQLANIVGSSPSMIGFYERFERQVPISIYNKLADIFHWPHYKQSPNETLSLDFEKPNQEKPNQEEIAYKGYITKAQIAELRAIAGIKGCSVPELLDKLIAPYAEALNALRIL